MFCRFLCFDIMLFFCLFVLGLVIQHVWCNIPFDYNQPIYTSLSLQFDQTSTSKNLFWQRLGQWQTNLYMSVSATFSNASSCDSEDRGPGLKAFPPCLSGSHAPLASQVLRTSPGTPSIWIRLSAPQSCWHFTASRVSVGFLWRTRKGEQGNREKIRDSWNTQVLSNVNHSKRFAKRIKVA